MITTSDNLAKATRAFSNNKLVDALKLYIDVLSSDPTNCEAHFGVAACYFQSGRWQQALEASVLLWQLGKQDRNSIYIILHSLVGGACLSDRGFLLDVLKKAILFDEFHQISLSFSMNIVHHQYPEKMDQDLLFRFIDDELVHLILSNSLNTSVQFEQSVIHALKFLYSEKEHINNHQTFIEACICQNIINDGLYTNILKLDQHNESYDDLESINNWLWVLPHKLVEAIEEKGELVACAVTKELQYQLEFCTQVVKEITPTADINEDKLASFYNQNPYPRWQYVNIANSSLDKILTSVDRSISSINSILVIGCGTGRQVIELALVYPDVKFTAIDTSQASIRYAKYMSELRQITNIEFYCGDFLTLALSSMFDFVLCTGVLHHLSSPLAGLAALQKLIKPNGTALIGLYSKTARKDLKIFNHEIQAIKANDNLSLVQAITKWRCQHIASRDQYLLNVEDFYSMAGLNDLLCHPQEYEFSCEELKTYLLATDLTFKTMLLSSYQVELLHQIELPADQSDLLYWDQVERISPNFFKNMINFIVTKES